MKLGIASSVYLSRYGVSEGAKKMKTHGYGYADFQNLADPSTPFFTQDEDAFIAEIKRIRRDAENEGIYFWQSHGLWCWPPPACATPEELAKCVDDVKKGIRGSAAVGAKYFILHPLMPFGWQMFGDEHVDEFFEINYNFFREVVAYAEKQGVIICLENMPMPDLPLGSVKAIVDFVKKINHPNLKICLDTGHVLVFGEQPSDAVRLIGRDLLATLHVHDNNGVRDQHLDPYQGVCKWDDFVSALKEIGFEGVFSMETNAPKGDSPEEITNAEIKFAEMIKNMVKD